MRSKFKQLVGARMTGAASMVLATIISLLGCVAGQCTPIIYTLSGVGTGDLGANAFNNASFTITSTADTSQITNPQQGTFYVPDITATISVFGIGSGTFNIPTINVNNQGGSPFPQIPAAAGFSAPNQGVAILFADNSAFETYDLSTPIGPQPGVPSFNPGAQFGTTAGNFSLTSVSSVTFQATTVPEPAIIPLFAVAGLAYWIRRKTWVMEASAQ